MRILITGGRGFVASALAARLSREHEVAALAHEQLDITRAADVTDAVRTLSPRVIINCAVLGVDTCEREPAGAELINVSGPRLLARAAARAGASIIHFSTNYVFDGERDDLGAYTPEDDAFPINVYGTTKLRGEAAVLSECERGIVVRTSWVFGRGANTFLSTLPSKLRARETIVAITDRFASVTYVEDLATRIDELLDCNEARGVFHAVNAGACSYAEFADAAAQFIGLSHQEREACIEYVAANDVAGAARRPRWTPMRCSRSEQLGLTPLRSWREALLEYCDPRGWSNGARAARRQG